MALGDWGWVGMVLLRALYLLHLIIPTVLRSRGNQVSEEGRDLPKVTKGTHNGGTTIHNQVCVPPVSPAVLGQQGAGHVNYPCLTKEETGSEEQGLAQGHTLSHRQRQSRDPRISELTKMAEIISPHLLKIQLRNGETMI